MISLYQNSDKTISYSLPGVPGGQTITKAIWMLKRHETDLDADAVVSIEATTPGGSPGDLSDTGASGTAAASFLIGQDAMDAVSPGNYMIVVKCVLANGTAYEVPATRETALMMSGGIDAQA